MDERLEHDRPAQELGKPWNRADDLLWNELSDSQFRYRRAGVLRAM